MNKNMRNYCKWTLLVYQLHIHFQKEKEGFHVRYLAMFEFKLSLIVPVLKWHDRRKNMIYLISSWNLHKINKEN